MPKLKLFAAVLFLIMSFPAFANRTTHWLEYHGTLDPSQSIGPASGKDGFASNGTTPLAPGQCFVTLQITTNGDSSMTWVGASIGRNIWVRSTRKTPQGAEQWYGFDGDKSQVTLDLDPTTNTPSSITYWVEGTNPYGQNDGTIVLRRTCTGLKLYFENWQR